MKQLLRFIKPYYPLLSVGVTIKFLGSIMDLLLPRLLAHVIDVAIPSKDIAFVWRLGIIMLICAGLAFLFNVFANRMAAAVARDTTKDLRNALFQKIIYLSNRQVDEFTIPSLISRMTTDTYNVHQMVGMMQRIGIRAPILLVGGIIMTLTLDPVLTLVMLSVIPFVVIITLLLTKKSIPLFKKVQNSLDTMVQALREAASGIRVIKGLSKTKTEEGVFDRINKQVNDDDQKASTTMALMSPSVNFMINLGFVLVIVAGAFRVSGGHSQVGSIIAFMNYFNIILNAVMAITRIISSYSKGIASMDRINEVLLTKAPDQGKNKEIDTQATPFISFNKVSFAYGLGNKGGNALTNISFSLNQGESLGIIGPTGSGKSTLAQLLMRFYDVGSGSILIGGKNINTLQVGLLRELFGVVFQHDILFQGNIKENITMNRDISDEDFTLAIHSAQAEDVIREKQGLTGEVAIRGGNFSGGQKQRLLVARALAAKPAILLLDDASSALDYRTDANMRKALKKDYSNSTLILIAQRISSILHCDKILVLDEGKAIGYGSHENLLTTCNLYRQMYRMQMGEGEAVEI